MRTPTLLAALAASLLLLTADASAGHDRHAREFDDGDDRRWSRIDDRRQPPRYEYRSLGTFRTKKDGFRRTTIGLPADADRVQLQGAGRGLVVHRAFARYHDGRVERLHRLEGQLDYGDAASDRLRQGAEAVLFLETEPLQPGRRGYAEVLVGCATAVRDR